jgi:hypothetical protein
LRNRFLIPRRDVANTLRSRRRRGTLAILEQLAFDVAIWPARAVEFYDQLGRNQSLDNLQHDRGKTVDVRDVVALDLASGPFGTLAHTVDIRSVGASRDHGRYNIPSVGVFVWRLRAYPLTQSGALRLDQLTNCYTFSLLGNDVPLYTRPRPEIRPIDLAGEHNVPGPISRRALERDLASYYGEDKSFVLSRSRDHPPIPPESIVVTDLSDWQRYQPDDGTVAVDPELGRIKFPRRPNLEDLAVSYHYGFSADLGGGEYERPLSLNTIDYSIVHDDHLIDAKGILASLKSEWGPLADELRDRLDNDFHQRLKDYDVNTDPDAEFVRDLRRNLNRILQGDSLYSFARFPLLGEEASRPDADGDTREAWRLVRQDPRGPWLIRLNRLLLERHFPNELALSFRAYRVVSRKEELGQPRPEPISEALMRWKTDSPRHALIEILDSADYTEQIQIDLDAGQTLELRAGDRCRPAIRLLNRRRAATDDLVIKADPGSRLIFDGLLITGRGVTVLGDPDSITIRHCTLVPGWEIDEKCHPQHGEQPSLTLIDSQENPATQAGDSGNGHTPSDRTNTRVVIEHSIIGSIRVQRDEVAHDPLEISLSDSILDATGRTEDALSDADAGIAHALLTIARCTVIGEICVHAIELAENSILYGRVRVARRHYGCVRFCSVTPDSRTPRRFNCQPDLAEQAALANAVNDALIRARRRVRPRFTSLRYGTPGYCRLANGCAPEITRGADDESEMGVFHDLFEPQRSANLRARLAEYAVAGMESAIIFVD